MNYKPRLDGLRCVAIVMVLLGHFLYFVGGVNTGIYGVNLFFVLSGFLITSILLSEKEKSFGMAYKKFISRRALRIFPLYYLAIVILIIWQVDNIQSNWPYLATYTYNFRVGNMSHADRALANGYRYGPYWSLSVEEQFYLFFPFIVLLLNKRKRWLLVILILFVISGFLQKFYNIFSMETHPYENLVTNMSALSVGALGALCMRQDWLNKKLFNSIFVEAFLLLSLAFMLQSKNEWVIFCGFPLVNLYLVIKGAVFSFKISAVDKFLANKRSIFIGRISYGIYIYHLMVMHLFNEYIFNPLWNWIPFESMGVFSKLKYNATLIKFPFVTSLVIFIAYLSFRYFELPILKLKDKYFK